MSKFVLGSAITFVVAFLLLAGCAGVDTRGGIRPAPGFSVAVVSGMEGSKTARLEDFKGRPLVLNVGAVWCPHCLHELPAFDAAYTKYKQDIAMLVVFIKSELPAIDELVEEKKPGFIVAHDPASEIGNAYGIKGIPVTLFIDAEGNITDEYLGGLTEESLSKKIEALLARGGAMAPK